MDKNERNCQYKTSFDTEFEADLAASRQSYRWKVEIITYKCDYGNHWHTANADPSKRNQHIREVRDYCDFCKCALKPGRWEKHKTFRGHMMAMRRATTGRLLEPARVASIKNENGNGQQQNQVDKPTSNVSKQTQEPDNKQ